MRRRISGRVAASKARTRTVSCDRSRLDQRQRRRPARHRLQRRDEPDQRPLPRRQPGLLRLLQPGDDRDPALGGGEIGLRRLDPAGERLALGPGAGGGAGRGARLPLQLLRAGVGGVRLLARLAQRRRRPAARDARAATAIPSKARRVRPPHRLNLRDDRDGWQGSRWRGTIARRASPGRADAARSRGRRRGAGRRLAARRIVEAVRRADQEARLANAVVAPALQPLRQFGRAQRLAGLVEQDGDAALGRRRLLAADIGQLRHLGRPGDPLQIALDQFGLGPAPDPPARDDVEQQAASAPRRPARFPRTPTSARDCRSCAPPAGTGGRSRRRRRSAPSPRPAALRPAPLRPSSRLIRSASLSAIDATCRVERPLAITI